jgi:hypothetical protein
VTLLTFNSKYVVTSQNADTTTSSSLVDDPDAQQTFTLSASKVVLVIYQANNVYGAAMPLTGMQNAISVDAIDKANSWDSCYISAYPVRNAVFWVGTLAAGSHTIKGRFASNTSGQTATISNRVLVIIIFDGDEFQYVDDATTATAPDGTLIDDPNAQVTFTPSATCKALILYNISNNGATESTYGKKAAIRVATTDYAQAEKSPEGSNYVDSVFTCHALSLSAVSTTVKGRFANSRTVTATVTIHRRQLAVLLLADSTLLDIVTSTTQVSTTSSALVDDTQATISRTTSDTRELLVVAVGTKRYNVSSALTGECYGIKVDANDRVNSRGAPGGTAYANSAGTAYAEQLTANVHTVQGRFSNNNGTDTAKIDARQVVALWFTVGGALTQNISETASETGASATISMSQVASGLLSWIATIPLAQIASQLFSYAATIPLTQTSIQSPAVANVSVPLTQVGLEPQIIVSNTTIPISENASETLTAVLSGLYVSLTETGLQTLTITNISFPLVEIGPEPTAVITNIAFSVIEIATETTQIGMVNVTQASIQGEQITNVLVPILETAAENGYTATFSITETTTQSVNAYLGGVKVTKIFLIIGDIAIQLSGD